MALYPPASPRVQRRVRPFLANHHRPDLDTERRSLTVVLLQSLQDSMHFLMLLWLISNSFTPQNASGLNSTKSSSWTPSIGPTLATASVLEDGVGSLLKEEGGFDFSKGLDMILHYTKELASTGNTQADHLNSTGVSSLFTNLISAPVGAVLQTSSGHVGIQNAEELKETWTDAATGLVENVGFLGRASNLKRNHDIPFAETLSSIHDKGVDPRVKQGAPWLDISSGNVHFFDTAGNVVRVLSPDGTDLLPHHPNHMNGGVINPDGPGASPTNAVLFDQGSHSNVIDSSIFGDLQKLSPNDAVVVDMIGRDATKILQDAVSANPSPIGDALSNLITNTKYLEESNYELPLAQLVPIGDGSRGGTLKHAEGGLAALLSESMEGVIAGKAAFEPAIKSWQRKKADKETATEAPSTTPIPTEPPISILELQRQRLVPGTSDSIAVERDTRRVVEATMRRLQETTLTGQSSFGGEAWPKSHGGQSSFGGRAIPNASQEVGFGTVVQVGPPEISELQGLPTTETHASLSAPMDGEDAPVSVDLEKEEKTTWQMNIDQLEDDVNSALYIVTATAQSMMLFVDSVYTSRAALVPFLGDQYTDDLMRMVLESVVSFSAKVREMEVENGQAPGTYFAVGEEALESFKDMIPGWLVETMESPQGLSDVLISDIASVTIGSNPSV